MGVMHYVQQALQEYPSRRVECTMHRCAGLGRLFPMLVAAWGRRSRHCASGHQCLPLAAPAVQGAQPTAEAVNHHCSWSPVPPWSVQSTLFPVLCPNRLAGLQAQGLSQTLKWLLCSVCKHDTSFALITTTCCEGTLRSLLVCFVSVSLCGQMRRRFHF